MCRTDIAPAARPLLGQILGDMATALATQAGVPASEVRIGPVDFGDHEAVSQPWPAARSPRSTCAEGMTAW